MTPQRRDAVGVDAPPVRPEPARGLRSTGAGDIIIDLTDAARTGAPVWPPGPSRRRWLVLVGVIAVVAASLAAANYSAALRWRTRALVAERRAAQASADAAAERGVAVEARRARDVARQRRRAMADQLAVSEADVAALEARVFALAGQRAQAEDFGLDAGVRPEALVRALRAQVDSCIAQVQAARGSVIAEIDAAAWQPALTAAHASCEQIAADLDALVSAAP